jgi:hypothetical protein
MPLAVVVVRLMVLPGQIDPDAGVMKPEGVIPCVITTEFVAGLLQVPDIIVAV